MVKAMVAMKEHKRVMMPMIIMLVLVLLFTVYANTVQVHAIAGIDDALFFTLFAIMIAAGVITTSAVAQQNIVADYYYQQSAKSELFVTMLELVAGYYADGILTISEAVKEGWDYLIEQVGTDFNGTEYEIEDYSYAEVYENGAAVCQYYPTYGTLTWANMTYKGITEVTMNTTSYVYHYYTENVSTETMWIYYLKCTRTTKSNSSQVTNTLAQVSYLKASKPAGIQIGFCFVQMTEQDQKYLRAVGMGDFQSSATVSTQSVQYTKDVPMGSLDVGWPSSTIPYSNVGNYQDVIGLFDNALVDGGTVTIDLINSGVLTDATTTDASVPVTATQAGVIAGAGAIGGEVVEPVPEDLTGYEMPDLRDKFPFCIPFDFIKLVKAFNQPSVTPNYSFDIEIPFLNVSQAVDLDFSDEMWGPCVQIVRWGVLVSYTLGLILITRKIIGG